MTGNLARRILYVDAALDIGEGPEFNYSHEGVDFFGYTNTHDAEERLKRDSHFDLVGVHVGNDNSIAVAKLADSMGIPVAVLTGERYSQSFVEGLFKMGFPFDEVIFNRADYECNSSELIVVLRKYMGEKNDK